MGTEGDRARRVILTVESVQERKKEVENESRKRMFGRVEG